jgi:hypothetical protein
MEELSCLTKFLMDHILVNLKLFIKISLVHLIVWFVPTRCSVDQFFPLNAQESSSCNVHMINISAFTYVIFLNGTGSKGLN